MLYQLSYARVTGNLTAGGAGVQLLPREATGADAPTERDPARMARPPHSPRSTRMGLVRAARRAGIQLATAATVARIRATPP